MASITKGWKRFFIVATRAEFHATYIRIQPEHRNFYEVITENDYCRLHFDIECSRELNPDFNYESAMEIFKNRVSREFGMSLAHNFDPDTISRLIDGSMCHEMFLEMDSTNNKKFSRHLVLNMRPGVFFKNNIDVGNFVDSLMHKIHCESLFMKNSTTFADISGSENMQNTRAMRRLYVLDSKGGTVFRKLMIDTTIYTRDRQFRLVLSSKYKGNPRRALYPYDSFMYTRDETEIVTYEYFISSLVSFSPHECRNCAILRISPMDDSAPPLQLDMGMADEKEAIPNVPVQAFGRIDSRVRESTFAVNQMFPHLITYFEVNIIKQWPEHDGESGFPYLPSAPYTPSPKSYISSVRFYPENNRVVLSIAHNRHCWNIGRRHRSNHIYFVISTDNHNFWQKCYDRECADFCSKKFSIGAEVFNRQI